MKNCIFVNKYVSDSLHPLFCQVYVFTNNHHNHNTKFASNGLLKSPMYYFSYLQVLLQYMANIICSLNNNFLQLFSASCYWYKFIRSICKNYFFNFMMTWFHKSQLNLLSRNYAVNLREKYIGIYVYIYTYIYIPIYTQIYTYIYIYMCVCECECVRMRVCDLWVYVYVYMCISIFISMLHIFL